MLGSKSGRDMDKMHDSGLTPMEVDGQVAFAEAKWILVCRKLYRHTFDLKGLPEEVMAQDYSGANAQDPHDSYMAEILAVYSR